MITFSLELDRIEAMLLPERLPKDLTSHNMVPVHQRGVRLEWAMELVKAVSQVIDDMWTRYSYHCKAYEHLNWSGQIPEAAAPAIPRDQVVNGYFLVEHVVKPLTEKYQEALYFRVPGTALSSPTLFISHAWQDDLGPLPYSTLGSLYADKSASTDIGKTAIWLDVLVYNQHVPQAIANDMEKIIGSVGALIFSFNSQHMLSRLWCLWELLCAHRSGAKIRVIEPAPYRYYFGKALEWFEKNFTSVTGAETTHAVDRSQILTAIESEFGTTQNADEFIHRIIRENVTRESDAPWRKRPSD
jgi:hypothetical protein